MLYPQTFYNDIRSSGYDPQQRYVGTWIGSMMTHLWVYDGAPDAAGRVLTLHTEGPHMAAEGQMAQYKDVIEFTGVVATALALGIAARATRTP
jgi:hypothetical protein